MKFSRSGGEWREGKIWGMKELLVVSGRLKRSKGKVRGRGKAAGLIFRAWWLLSALRKRLWALLPRGKGDGYRDPSWLGLSSLPPSVQEGYKALQQKWLSGV